MATIPNVTVSGTLINVISVIYTEANTENYGTVVFALCGYGSQIPRVAGTAVIAAPTSFNVEVESPGEEGPTGKFQVAIYSNDLIEPDGTYYTVTVRNNNGDVVQVNAYRFLGAGQFDISNLTPYDPNQPPPELPPLILNLLLIVPYNSAPDFPGDTFTSWQITLNGDATATFSNLIDGHLYTIIIVQDGSGDHNFTWPLNAYNPTLVNQEPSAMTVQTFVAVSNMLYPIGAGTYWP